MGRYILHRLALIVPIILGVTLVVFLILAFIPGDPAQLMLGEAASKEAVEALRAELGLDQPLLIRYGIFLKQLLQGNLGTSYIQRAPVLKLIVDRLPATLELTFFAMLVGSVIGVLAGIISATKQHSLWDYAAMFVSILGVSMPVFWLGIMLILFFSVNLGWLPVSGRGPGVIAALPAAFGGDFGPLIQGLRHILLPSITLGTGLAALIARMTRSSMLEIIRQDYMKTAKAKGLPGRLIIWKHALRNALIPVVTALGLQFGQLLGGAVLTESIFAWPGLGRLAVDAINARDFPVIQGVVLVITLGVVLVNLLVDLIYTVIDPRIRYS
ncbi:MAG: ABC transporter permease [Firmicutes bacterium]|nr:ABC transporter permease [Bacillota bacterium]